MNITDGSHRTKYYLSGSAVTLEENGTDKIYYTYYADGDLISMNLNGKEYFYIRNVQNDVIGLHDTEGTVVVSYSYDTWGNIVSITGSLKDSVGKKNPYRYRGYRYDEETGMYYLQSRYYNAEWGRFINADAVIGQPGDILSFNMFGYCHNNPVNMSDDSGYWPKWMKTAAKAVKKTVSKVVKKVNKVYNTVKTKVVNTYNSLSKTTKKFISFGVELGKSAADSKIGQGLAKVVKPKETYQYSKTKGMQGLCCSYTEEASIVFRGANKVSKVAGIVGVVTAAFTFSNHVNEGNYVDATKDVLNFAAGIGVGMFIGSVGLAGGWAIGAAALGAIVTDAFINICFDIGNSGINYIRERRG